MEASLGELESVLDTLEFEEEGFLRLDGFKREGERLVVTLYVHTGGEEETSQTWAISCEDALAYRFRSEIAYGIEVVTDDPVLWEYQHPNALLYCVGADAEDADAIVGSLYRTYRAAVGEAATGVDFWRGLNAINSLPHGSGLVAKGPVPLLEAYLSTFETLGLKASIIGKSAPKLWNGNQWVPISSEVRLLVCGESHVVAGAFSVQRVA